MKKLFSKLDKIGVGIFILILINLVILLFSRDFSRFEFFDFSFLFNLITGILLIFKSKWCKSFALFLSVLSLILILDQKIPSDEQISYMLNMLPHFVANGSLSIAEIFYFFILPVFIASYCVFEIATGISNNKRKKLV